MKNICGLVCVLSFITTIACFIKILPKRGALEQSVKYILLFGSLITCSYIFVLFAQDENQARIAYSLEGLWIAWMLAFILQYSAKFIGVLKKNKPIHYLIISLLVVESLLAIKNILMPYSIDIVRHSFGGDTFFSVNPLPPHYFHYLLCYGLVLTIIIFFCYAYKKMSRVYWQKYDTLVKAFFSAFIINTCSLMMRLYVDISVLIYGIIAYHIFWVHFSPSRFMSEIKSLLIDSHTNGILVFDNKDLLVLYNKKSAGLFSLTEDMLEKTGFDEFVSQNAVLPLIRRNTDGGYYYSIEKDGERHFYYVDYSRIIDEKGLFVGSYLIFHDETIQRKLIGQQHFLIENDHLTGIPNRKSFAIETQALLHSNPDIDFVFIQFDIDNFRIINQLFGNKAGNALLQSVANFLKEYVRDGTYARLEADHFAICVPETNIKLEELLDGIAKCVGTIGVKLQLRASFGIYRIEDKTIPVEQMYDMATMAARAVKGNYCEYFAYYDDKMRESILQEQEIIGEMENALKNKQFEVFLQPQYNYTTGKIVGAEALVRWNHPEKGYIIPVDFIPIFEKNGFIVQLDQYVWEFVCRLLCKWGREDSPLRRMPISVNISRIDFYRMDLCGTFIELAKKYKFNPRQLRLEVTESAYIGNPEHMINTINKLQSYGFIIEMDDFGSGYSSLNILKSVPVNVLKLDMKFLSGDGDYEKGSRILRSVVLMSELINLPIIAEGVETREQADYLNSIGCEIMQGYYYSNPLPIEDFERLIRGE